MTGAVRVSSEREWSHFPHVADIGIEGRGKSLPAAFEQAAVALTAIVTTAPVAPNLALELECEAPNRELLLVEWLNAIIYEMATRNMLFGRFAVHVSRNRLRGKIWGEPVDRARHQPAAEPKGATYTALRVDKDAKGNWTARCVIDV
jgi:SHS2 domain-containing protein